MMPIPARSTRQPLEGGTLMVDYLGPGTIVARQRANERRIDDLAANISSGPAGGGVQDGTSWLMTGWGQANVSAGLSATTLNRFGVAAQSDLILPFDATIVSLWLVSTESRTAGSLTVQVYIGGSASGMEATLDGSNPQTYLEAFTAGDYTFATGEAVSFRLTTSADFAPTSADIQVSVEVTALVGE